MHPGAWVAWISCALAVGLATTNPFYLLPLGAVAWVVYVACGAPGAGARCFSFFVKFGAFALVTRTALVVVGPVTKASVLAAALEGLRIGVLLALVGAFNSAADPYRLLRLAPRRMHEPALAATLALTIAPRYIDAAATVREAQRLRGIRTGLRSLPALVVPVLETGMEEALVLAESMDARGHGRGPRSRYRPERFGRGAWIVASASAAAAVIFFVGGSGDLAMRAIPPTWPDVSWLRLGAVIGLAAPAAVGAPR